MNKALLVKEVSKKTSQTQKTVENVINITMDVIIKTVRSNKKVSLSGFGTFEPRQRNARNGRNPKTGQVINIPEKTIPYFSPGKNFKDSVNR